MSPACPPGPLPNDARWRLVAVDDEPMTYAFAYATLPDHPACGYGTFTIRIEYGAALFRAEVLSHPANLIIRFGAPIGRELQRRATKGCLSALERWTSDGT